MIYLISDTHFGLRYEDYAYCKAFKGRIEQYDTPEKADIAIIENWNRTVGDDDIVFSLGDFTYENTDFYLKQLRGNKILIRGNHDNQDNWYVDPKAGSNDAVIEYRGQSFFLTHDPDWVPKEWIGWVIHGHHHWMPSYPFIDGKWKTINVAVEMINFTPISLDWILSLNIDTIWRMETSASTPIRR